MKTSLGSACALVVSLAACAAPQTEVPDDRGGTTSRMGGGGSGSSGGNGVIRAEGQGANVRAGTSTSTQKIGALSDGTRVNVECWSAGQSIEGNERWDYLPSEGGYVSDALVRLTGDVAECDGKQAGGAAIDEARPAPQGTDGSLGARLIAEARQYLGMTGDASYCNAFSPQVSGNACQHWCADFLYVVWRDGGADTSGLGSASISFYRQASASGRWKDGAYNADVQPGDAVIWANSYSWGEHVGMVTEVSGDDIRVIHGNFQNSVYESTISRSNQIGTGAPIIGYASPRAR